MGIRQLKKKNIAGRSETLNRINRGDFGFDTLGSFFRMPNGKKLSMCSNQRKLGKLDDSNRLMIDAQISKELGHKKFPAKLLEIVRKEFGGNKNLDYMRGYAMNARDIAEAYGFRYSFTSAELKFAKKYGKPDYKSSFDRLTHYEYFGHCIGVVTYRLYLDMQISKELHDGKISPKLRKIALKEILDEAREGVRIAIELGATSRNRAIMLLSEAIGHKSLGSIVAFAVKLVAVVREKIDGIRSWIQRRSYQKELKEKIAEKYEKETGDSFLDYMFNPIGKVIDAIGEDVAAKVSKKLGKRDE